MRVYWRFLKYLKSLWKQCLLGTFLIGLLALLNGASIAMLYPVMSKVLAGPKEEEIESRGLYALFGDASALVRDGVKEVARGIREPRHLPNRLKRSVGEGWTVMMARYSRLDVLTFLCLVVVMLVFAKAVCTFGQRALFIRVEQRMMMNIRNDLFAHVQHLSLSFFHRNRTGGLISRVINDVEVVREFTLSSAVRFLRDISEVLVYLSIAMMVDLKLSLLTFAVLPPILLLLGRFINKLRRYSRRSQERIAELTYLIQETFSSIRIVKAFTAEPYESRRFARENNRYRRVQSRLQMVQTAIRPMSELLTTVIGVGVLWYGGRRIVSPGAAMHPAQFLLFLGALFSMMRPAKSIGNTYGNFKKGLGAAERVLALFDEHSEVPERPDAVETSGIREGIRFRHVCFSYEDDRPVLMGIDFSVRMGEVVALVGPSGGGKSTLADLILRFYDPTEGAIEIDGTDLRDIKQGSLRGLIGIVTQETLLFDDTARANIAYGREEVPDGKVISAAKAANAHEFITELPEGYDTRIGEGGVFLSGGQRQRLAIARAILKDPPILILDEATSSLDSASERLVRDALDRLVQDRTTFVIAHRLSTIQSANRIMVIERGRIVEMGTHVELIGRDGLYRKLCGMQFVGSPLYEEWGIRK